MISKRKLQAVVDTAEQDFRWCWTVLAGMKGRSDCEYRPSGTDIVEYQKRLLTAIQSVERAYRDIKQEERRLVGRKASYRPAWFGQRMKQLSQHSNFLMDVLSIGRALGDGFAWFFYERDRDLIAEHFKHKRQPLLPPGTGGLGETQSLVKFQGLGQQLLLYHGTTTFLRMGDVTFVDLKKQRVASIGEIKTKHVGGPDYTISMLLISPDKDRLPSVSRDRSGPEATLDPDVEVRRKRQAREIGEALTRARASSVKSPHGGVHAKFHLDALTEVVSKCGLDRFECVRVSPGLLIGAFRLRIDSLGSELVSGGTGRLTKIADDMMRNAKELIDTTLSGNCMHIGHVGGGRADLILRPETIPLLWWDVPDTILEQILFHRVLAWTLYNPAHLWQKLRSRGFEVLFEEGLDNPQVTRVANGRRMVIENLGSLREMVQRSLMTEESLLELLDTGILVTEASGTADSVMMELRPRFTRHQSAPA